MRKAHLLIPAAAIAAVVAILAQPASAETKTYSLSGFQAVDASAGVKVVLKQGAFDVKVESPSGRFDELKVEKRGDTLVIGRQNSWGNWKHRPDFTITVSAPNYEVIDASSGSHVDGGSLSLKRLTVDISSGAHVELGGSCSDLRIDVSSGSHFDGENLKCETASVDASSGAHAEAYASRTAFADASSGSHVAFHGKPAQLTKDTSSGASVSSQ